MLCLAHRRAAAGSSLAETFRAWKVAVDKTLLAKENVSKALRSVRGSEVLGSSDVRDVAGRLGAGSAEGAVEAGGTVLTPAEGDNHGHDTSLRSASVAASTDGETAPCSRHLQLATARTASLDDGAQTPGKIDGQGHGNPEAGGRGGGRAACGRGRSRGVTARSTGGSQGSGDAADSARSQTASCPSAGFRQRAQARPIPPPAGSQRQVAAPECEGGREEARVYARPPLVKRLSLVKGCQNQDGTRSHVRPHSARVVAPAPLGQVRTPSRQIRQRMGGGGAMTWRERGNMADGQTGACRAASQGAGLGSRRLSSGAGAGRFGIGTAVQEEGVSSAGRLRRRIEARPATANQPMLTRRESGGSATSPARPATAARLPGHASRRQVREHSRDREGHRDAGRARGVDEPDKSESERARLPGKGRSAAETASAPALDVDSPSIEVSAASHT